MSDELTLGPASVGLKGLTKKYGTTGVVRESPGLASALAPGDSALLAWDAANAVVLPAEE